MSLDVRQQLKEIGDAQRSSRIPVELQELRRVVADDGDDSTSSWRSREAVTYLGAATLQGPAVALVMAAMILAFGAVALLLAGSPTPGADVVDSVNEIPDMGPAVVVDGHEPFGPVSVEYSVGERALLPDGNVFQHDWATPHGGIVRTDAGFLALASSDAGPMRLVHSIDGSTGWEEVEINLDFGAEVRGRLFEAGGWYWIETLAHTALYRSADAMNWDEIDVACDRSCVPVGFPFVDHRFVSFGDQLVAFGPEVVMVDMVTGAVSSSPAPWSMPDTFWLSTSLIGDELHVILSPFDDAGSPEAPQEWVYRSPGGWAGPAVPTLAAGENLLGVVGQPNTGYVAASAEYESFRGFQQADGFFSADGQAWERFDVPLGYEVFDPVTPIKINGKQALVSFRDTTAGRHALWLSDDGVTWQLITLEVPDGERMSVAGRVTVSAIDDTMFIYHQNLSTLSVWKVTFDD